MLRFFILLGVLIAITATAQNFEYGYLKNGYKYVMHRHNESSYQHFWCSSHNGIEEYENTDKTRVDCLTKTHAVEFDFANKWAESIGQALHYQLMTNKKAKVVLILENPSKQKLYYKRVKKLGEIYNFDTEYITPNDIGEEKLKCPYIDCKCHKNEKNKK